VTSRLGFKGECDSQLRYGLLTSPYDRYSLISAAVKPAYRLYDLSGRVAREVKTKTEYNAAVSLDTRGKCAQN
jgi:hypothetical protein